MFSLFAGIDVPKHWNMYLHVAIGMLICFFVLGVFLSIAILISLVIRSFERRHAQGSGSGPNNNLRSFWWSKRNWRNCLMTVRHKESYVNIICESSIRVAKHLQWFAMAIILWSDAFTGTGYRWTICEAECVRRGVDVCVEFTPYSLQI